MPELFFWLAAILGVSLGLLTTDYADFTERKSKSRRSR